MSKRSPFRGCKSVGQKGNQEGLMTPLKHGFIEYLVWIRTSRDD